ncbi:hypothetical protein N0V90_013519 [Kalmusia sp. IMI 367209]|nr:hypothetical protein N0V90_013519 [Kalmusia sp. IMI 367209]
MQPVPWSVEAKVSRQVLCDHPLAPSADTRGAATETDAHTRAHRDTYTDIDTNANANTDVDMDADDDNNTMDTTMGTDAPAAAAAAAAADADADAAVALLTARIEQISVERAPHNAGLEDSFQAPSDHDQPPAEARFAPAASDGFALQHGPPPVQQPVPDGFSSQRASDNFASQPSSSQGEQTAASSSSKGKQPVFEGFTAQRPLPSFEQIAFGDFALPSSPTHNERRFDGFAQPSSSSSRNEQPAPDGFAQPSSSSSRIRPPVFPPFKPFAPHVFVPPQILTQDRLRELAAPRTTTAPDASRRGRRVRFGLLWSCPHKGPPGPDPGTFVGVSCSSKLNKKTTGANAHTSTADPNFRPCPPYVVNTGRCAAVPPLERARRAREAQPLIRRRETLFARRNRSPTPTPGRARGGPSEARSTNGNPATLAWGTRPADGGGAAPPGPARGRGNTQRTNGPQPPAAPAASPPQARARATTRT